MSISPSQCRAGRALVNLDQNDLAAAASVSRGVIIDFEKERRTPGANNLAAIQTALEQAGVVFIEDDRGEGVVKLRDRPESGTGIIGG